MYSRIIKVAPKKIVQNGKANFGTFFTPPKKMNIKGMFAPYGGIPWPPFLSRFRIRSRAFYVFSVGDFFATIDFFDNKIFGIVEFSLWNKKTGVKYVYRNLLGIRWRLVPLNLECAQCLNPSSSRYVRLSWNRIANRFSLKVFVRGFKHRPEIKLSVFGNFKNENFSEIFCVSPAPTTSRCSATWYAASPAKSSLQIVSQKKQEFNEQGNGLLYVNRAYYRFFTDGHSVCAAGKIEGNFISLRLLTTTMDSSDSNKYNENVLFCNQKFSPMPPVCITHPFGIEKIWFIQDFENMVDLEFVPQNFYERKTNLIFVKNDSQTVFGFLNGVIFDGAGKKIVLEKFPAVAKRNIIRL